jgi:hypothetical protein
MRGRGARRGLPLLVGAVALLAAACGGGGLAGYGDDGAASGGGGDGMTLEIVTPAAGAEVTQPFTLQVRSSEPLGEPDTGRHHVHVWFDGKEADYKINYTDSFRVTGLPAGEHVITAALANADHSPAGPKADVTVNVGGGQTATTGAGPGGYDNG